jgi:hypothetical protein
MIDSIVGSRGASLLAKFSSVVGPLEELTKLLPLVMATHGMNDRYGKFIGSLAVVPLMELAQAVVLISRTCVMMIRRRSRLCSSTARSPTRRW